MVLPPPFFLDTSKSCFYTLRALEKKSGLEARYQVIVNGQQIFEVIQIPEPASTYIMRKYFWTRPNTPS